MTFKTSIAVLIAACLALAAGCSTSDPDTGTGAPSALNIDLDGVPLSRDLAPVLQASLDTPIDEPTPIDRLLAFHDSLTVAVQRPESRQDAGDLLYQQWDDDPDQFLWIQTAVRYEYLLHRGDGLTRRMRAAATDSAHPARLYAEACRSYGYGSRGDLFRQAATDSAVLADLDRLLLEEKLAMVDADGGASLDAVGRMIEGMSASRSLGLWTEMRSWYLVTRYLQRADRLDDALHAAARGVELMEHTDSQAWRGRFMILVASIRESRRETELARDLMSSASEYGVAHDLPWIFLKSTDHAAALSSSLGDLRGALAFDQLILAHSIAMQDSLNAPRNLMNIAYDHRLIGQLDSCLVYQQRARRWVDAYDNARNRAMLPFFEAEYYCQVGDYRTAVELLSEAQNRGADASLAIDEARLHLGMIEQGLEMGQPDLAHRSIDRLHELRPVLHDNQPDQNLVADYETVTAEFLTGQGEYALAAEAVARARTAVAKGGGEGKAWRLHRAAGLLALRRGDLRSAHRDFEAALDLSLREGGPGQQASSRFLLGHCLLEMERWNDARDLFDASTSVAGFGQRFRTRLSTLIFLGRAHRLEGDADQALAHLDRADSLLTPYAPPELAAHLKYESALALRHIDRHAEADEVLRNAGRLLGLSKAGTVEELATFHESLRRDIVEHAVAWNVDDGAHEAALADALGFLGSGELVEPGDAASLLSRVRGLAGDAPLVVHFVGRERSHTWVMAPDGIDHHSLPGRRDLLQLISPVLADLSTPAREIDRSAIRELADLLLGPCRSSWPQGRSLFVCADDVLRGLPWAALPFDGERDAVDHGPVVELLLPFVETAVSPVAGLVTTPARGAVLMAIGLDDHAGTGDTLDDLHHAEAEARQVAEAWAPGPVELRIGEAASWASLMESGLSDAAVIHIATHAVVRGSGGATTLQLAGGRGAGSPTLDTIAGTGLAADLVYLSCCEGTRRRHVGAGSADLARAFLTAGARSVVASSVRVDDHAALAMARSFTSELAAGSAPDVALRTAQLETRQADPELRHPYYWAFYRVVTAIR